MKINGFAGLLALSTLGLVAMSPAVQAQTNGSFENPSLTTPGDYTINNIPDWSFSGSVQTYSYGVFRPTTAAYPAGVPDGVQAAYVSNGAIYQDESAITANTAYSLSVYVGSRLDQPGGAGTVNLETAGGAILASQSLSPLDGTFGVVNLNYVVGNSNPFIGDTLRIVLAQANGSQVNFDKVSLGERIVPTSVVPEGNALFLLLGGMAPVGLGLAARRSRKS